MRVAFQAGTTIFALQAISRLLRDSELYVEIRPDVYGHLLRAMHDFERVRCCSMRPARFEPDEKALECAPTGTESTEPIDVDFAAATIPIAKVAIEIWIRRGVLDDVMQYLTPALEDLADVQRRLVEAVRSESEAIAAALADELKE